MWFWLWCFIAVIWYERQHKLSMSRSAVGWKVSDVIVDCSSYIYFMFSQWTQKFCWVMMTLTIDPVAFEWTSHVNSSNRAVRRLKSWYINSDFSVWRHRAANVHQQRKVILYLEQHLNRKNRLYRYIVSAVFGILYLLYLMKISSLVLLPCLFYSL